MMIFVIDVRVNGSGKPLTMWALTPEKRIIRHVIDSKTASLITRWVGKDESRMARA